jgi:sugar phosphate permease
MLSPIRKAIHLVLPDPGYLGWWVVAACLLCTALSAPGQSYALALYMEPIAAALGGSRVEVATVYAWATLAAAAVLPLAGRVADRASSRSYLAGVVALLGLSLLLLSAVSSWPALAVSFFCLRLLGQGATGLGVLTTVLRWFHQNRGRAIAIAVLGYAVGEFFMPGIIVGLQDAVGWRSSLIALASVYLVVFAPIVFAVVRASPARPRDTRRNQTSVIAPEITAAAAVRMPRFWVLAALVSVTPFVLTGILLNHVALFDHIGWTTMDVARALQGYAVSSLVTTYAVGSMLDRLSSRFGVLSSMTLLALALLVPLGMRSGFNAVVLYGSLLGAAAGATNATNGVLWPDYFGTGSVGAIKGIVSTVRNATTAAAAPLAAWLIGTGDGFSTTLLAGAVLAAAAAIVAIFLPSPSLGQVDVAAHPTG